MGLFPRAASMSWGNLNRNVLHCGTADVASAKAQQRMLCTQATGNHASHTRYDHPATPNFADEFPESPESASPPQAPEQLSSLSENRILPSEHSFVFDGKSLGNGHYAAVQDEMAASSHVHHAQNVLETDDHPEISLAAASESMHRMEASSGNGDRQQSGKGYNQTEDRNGAGIGPVVDPIPAYQVEYVNVTGGADLRQQRQATLRLMWDADSVPYSNAVLSAVTHELGNTQVQSIDVFATGPTAMALCGGSTSGDTPAGGVLRVGIGGGTSPGAIDAAASLTAHTMQVAHSDTAACMYVIISSNPNAIPTLTTLRTLGHHVAAVTASVGRSSTPPATATHHCASAIHLTLAPATAADATNAGQAGHLHTDAFAQHNNAAAASIAAPLASSPLGDRSQFVARVREITSAGNGAMAARHPAGAGAPPPTHNGAVESPDQMRELQRLGSIIGDPLVPPQTRQMLQQPLGVLCVVLSSALDRVSEYNVARLQERVRRSPDALCAAEDFPHEILAVPSLRFALVAGFAAESTWLPCEKAAVLEMLLTVDDWDLFAQLGFLSLAVDVARLPPLKSSVARTISTNNANAAAGRALLAHMLHRARGLADLPHLQASSGAAAAAAAAAAGPAALLPDPYAAGDRWYMFASCLDRVSINWFAVIRSHMLREPEFWTAVEDFPVVLCTCDGFRRQTLATVGSAVVREAHKRAIAQALLKLEQPELFAQIGFTARFPEADRLPESIRKSADINMDPELRAEGKKLLASLSSA